MNLAENERCSRVSSSLQMYVDFEDAFQDDNTNHDYFGGQSDSKSTPSQTTTTTEKPSEDDPKPANFYLQSVETVSEVPNGNYSPLMRYHVSRENSHPSTPSDTPPVVPRSNQRSTYLGKNSRLNNSQQSSSSSNGHSQLSNDFTNLNLIENNETHDTPAPFTPDAIRLKLQETKPYDDSLIVSSQFKLILPQYFLVKYLGRTACSELWGTKAVRGPIDEMVQSARQLPSMNEIPTLEACINTRGLTLSHRYSPVRGKNSSRNGSPERHQHGLIPLEYISYVMHDMKYSKISACIVLRQKKPTATMTSAKTTESTTNDANETVTECYGFLFQSKEHAHRFALSLAEAFNARKHSSRHGKNHQHYNRREGRSPNQRSRQRQHPPSIPFHHERIRAGQYDDSYLRDSEV